MRNLLKRLHNEEEAATAVEYAIIAAIVGVALIGTLIAFRDSISAMLNRATPILASLRPSWKPSPPTPAIATRAARSARCSSSLQNP